MTRVRTHDVGEAICENVLQIVTKVFQNLGFEGVQISFYWQAHRKMTSQLLRSERMSLYVDPRIARIPYTVCANGHLEAKVDQILVPRHSDL